MPTAAPVLSSSLFAWLLPGVGWLVVLGIPMLLRGPARRIAFAVGPFLLGWAMWWVGPPVTANRTNWLLELVGLAYYGAAWLAIVIYYPMLLAYAIGSWLRRNAELRKAAAEPQPE